MSVISRRFVCGCILGGLFSPALLLASAGTSGTLPNGEIIVSVKDQKLMLLSGGKSVAVYTVSTSRFGTGDREGSYATPLGHLGIREKIGMGLPMGAVLQSRHPTGEILLPNAPGRDPIVSRILWLEGREPGNRNAFARCIYIHGTPRERELGRPASYGCIRMRSRDVAQLSDRVERGMAVTIIKDSLPKAPCASAAMVASRNAGPVEVVPAGREG